MDYMQLLDVILHVDKSLGILIEQYGTMIYMVLFLIIFCETGLVVLPFLPGDSLLFIAGTFCATGAMNIWVLSGLLIVAAITGNTLNYWIGSAVGHRVFTHNYKWLNPEALRKTHSFYEKHGGKTIILARFTPIVRTFAPFIAGVSEMTFVKFQFFNIIGAILWVVSLLATGYLFGNMPLVRDHLNTFVLIGIAAAILPIVLGAGWQFYRKMTSGRRNKAPDA
ncbi:VTT domain-containing protein [Herbaspirillum autotrophicum]|uniref:VTT domain-containing protein n=1 Tax=Herbaspirillum autotrophicum TaxID=180195 RepID=UPI00067D7555|nr:VTT domain-containing protein [Herbaspirillum autotrophicum]